MTLISTNHPLYLRRLVRELNAQVNGFYTPGWPFNIRCNRARLKGGELQVKEPSPTSKWFQPRSHRFTDAYGREIVASRKPDRRVA